MPPPNVVPRTALQLGCLSTSELGWYEGCRDWKDRGKRMCALTVWGIGRGGSEKREKMVGQSAKMNFVRDTYHKLEMVG